MLKASSSIISASQIATPINVNLVMGNGFGIDFSATSGTGTSELLNDYEEGTWTPTIGGTSTYFTQLGTYTKIGRTVQIEGVMHINAVGTGNGYEVLGLPFLIANNTIGGTVSISIWENLMTTPVYASGWFLPNTTQILLYAITTGSFNMVLLTILGANSKIHFSGSYSV